MKNIDLTLDDKIILRDILDLILSDDDLRRGFRVCSAVTCREMGKLSRKLNKQIVSELNNSTKA